MKTFLLFARALLVFLAALCAVASAHPSYGPNPPKMAFEFGYRAFIDMSPVPRGLLSSEDVASGRLSKRQCGTGDLYCPATSFCCNPGYSCCGYTFCCAAGYACPVSGPCVLAAVVTVTYTTTDVITSYAVSTIYSSLTSWVTLTSTGYTTVTTHVHNGVSTSTVWTTITTIQAMKRGAPAAPTPTMTETHDVQAVTPKPSTEPSLVEGQTPIADLLRRALANVGLLEKRDITSYQTIVFTSTYYSYSYYTVSNVVTSTRNTAVQLTVTSTFVDDASTTITVASTVTTTVWSRGHVTTTPPAPGPSPSPAPPPSGKHSALSRGAKIGIGVGVSLAAVLVFGLVGSSLWRAYHWWAHHRNPPPRRTTIVPPKSPTGAGAAGVATGVGATNLAAQMGGEKAFLGPISPTHQAYRQPQPDPNRVAEWVPIMTALGFTPPDPQRELDAATKEKIEAIRVFNAPAYRSGDEIFEDKITRVVYIDPASSLSDKIVCRLELMGVQPVGMYYEALSYSWGHPCEVELITVNEKPFKVTTDLASAIRRLRQPHMEVVIWIDQLCIKQGDKEEKTVQLACIPDVYRNARRTWVWLGEGTEESDNVFLHLTRAVDRAREHLQKTGLLPIGCSPDDVHGEVEQALHTTFANSLRLEFQSYPLFVRQLGELFNRDWFQRLWVVEEIIVSKWSEALCGAKSISFWTISNAFGIFLRDSATPDLPTTLTMSSIANNRLALLGSFKDQKVGQHPLDLMVWLEVFGTTQKCYNPRDRVLALLGVAADGEEPALVALRNYKHSTAHIYTKATEHMIRRSTNLDIICIGRGPRRDPELPSWVPDFRSSEFSSARSLRRMAFNPGHGFTASGDRYERVSPGQWLLSNHLSYRMPRDLGPQFEDSNVLVVSGVFVDGVSKVGQAYEFKSSTANNITGAFDMSLADRRHHDEVMDEVKDLAFGKGYPNSENHIGAYYPRLNIRYEEAFQRTMTCDLNRKTERLGRKVMQFDFLGGDPSKPLLDPLRPSLAFVEMSQRAFRMRRRFMRSDSGLIGLVPIETRPNDCIYVLIGCSVPVILRRSTKMNPSSPGKQFFTFVGECYVHGIMDGEVITDVEQNRLKCDKVYLI